MRDLRNRLRVLAVFVAAGELVSFLPSFSPARARAGGAVRGSCTNDAAISTRRGTSRASMSPSSLQAAEQQDSHAVLEGQDTDGDLTERKSKIRPRWSKGQGSWSTPKTSNVEPAGGGGGGGGGGEGEVGMGPAMTALSQDAEGATDGDLEDEIMAELGQAGGLEEEEESDAPAPRTRKRLKKFFLKDFEGTSWTVAVQWKSRPFKIETTKVALKEDGSVVWLDKGKGSWRLRTKTRDLVFYRDYFLNWNGKRIFAAKLLDNSCDMYLEGEIKGWGPFQSLDTLGSFQAVRRGITIDDNTPRPPWESREAPQPEPEEGKRSKTNKDIFVDVELD
ncbi:unnamed protein product [Laminaria digitata]